AWRGVWWCQCKKRQRARAAPMTGAARRRGPPSHGSRRHGLRKQSVTCTSSIPFIKTLTQPMVGQSFGATNRPDTGRETDHEKRHALRVSDVGVRVHRCRSYLAFFFASPRRRASNSFHTHFVRRV